MAPGGDTDRDDDGDGFPDGVLQQSFSPSAAARGIFTQFNYFFVDGHVAPRRWSWPKRLGPGKNEPAENDLNLQDLRWLQAGLPEP
ncbi:MAG: hypothetical protein HYU43_09200 [Armatimonadetes bacterium]|nr:hypothetical protein [Armatimonadota bacterium]